MDVEHGQGLFIRIPSVSSIFSTDPLKMSIVSPSMESVFTPLYHELKERLEDEILSSGLEDGHFFCTLKDICDRHNVSITTARKAVDALQKSGVVRSKSSRGLYVVGTERLLHLKSLKNHVLIFHAHEAGSQNVFFSLRLGAMLEVFAEKLFTAKVVFKVNGTMPACDIPPGAVRGIVAGSTASEETIQQYARTAPTLILGGSSISLPGVYQISYDIGKRADMAADYFLANGISECIVISHANQEIETFSAVLKKRPDIRFTVKKVAEPSIECGRNCVAQLAGLPPSVGIMAGDDGLAVGLVDTFLKNGCDLREKKRVVALANPKFPFTREYGIPVVGNDPWVVGRTAAEFLCAVLDGTNPVKRQRITLAPEASWLDNGTSHS